MSPVAKYLCAVVAWLALSFVANRSLFHILERHVTPAALEAVLWGTVAALFVLCMAAATLIGRKSLSRHPNLPSLPTIEQPVRSQTVIDPKKWRLDPETGEYNLITFKATDGILTDASTYRERLGRRLQAQKDMYPARVMTLTCIVVVVVGYIGVRLLSEGPCDIFLCYGPHDPAINVPAVLIYAAGVVGLFCYGWSWASQAIQLRYDPALQLGPYPTLPQNPEDALNVDDPSDARQPGLSEIESMLHGRTHGGSGREPSFPA